MRTLLLSTGLIAALLAACGDDSATSGSGGGDATTATTATTGTTTGAGGETGTTTGAGGDATSGAGGESSGGAGGAPSCDFTRPDLDVTATFADGEVVALASGVVDRSVVGTISASGAGFSIDDDAGDTTFVDVVGGNLPDLVPGQAVELRVVGTEADAIAGLYVELVDAATSELIFAANTGWPNPVVGALVVVDLDASCTYSPQNPDDYTKESYEVRVTVGDANVVVARSTTTSVPGTLLEVAHDATLVESLYDGEFIDHFEGVVVRRMGE